MGIHVIFVAVWSQSIKEPQVYHMKKIFTTLTVSLLLGGAGQAKTVNAALDFADAGNYSASGVTTIDGLTVSTGVTVSTPQRLGGATFDIVYTLGSTAKTAHSFVSSSGSQYGVGADNDNAAHYKTLEGNDHEGISFTDLSITNFKDNGSGIVIGDISDLKFISVSVNSAGNARDGVNIGYTGFVATDNVNLSTSSDAGQNISLSALENYPKSPALATALYLKTDDGQTSNRWAVDGMEVSYYVDIPEPSACALLVGLLGFGCVMVRRRK